MKKLKSTSEFSQYLVKSLKKDTSARVLFLKEFYELPIPSQIKVLRTIRGLSQVVLSRRTGFAQPEIARVERSTANPRISTVKTLFEKLGVRLEPMHPNMITLLIRQQTIALGEQYFLKVA